MKRVNNLYNNIIDIKEIQNMYELILTIEDIKLRESLEGQLVNLNKVINNKGKVIKETIRTLENL